MNPGSDRLHDHSDMDMDVHDGVASHAAGVGAGTGVYYEASSASTAFFADSEDNVTARNNEHTELTITRGGLSRLDSDGTLWN